MALSASLRLAASWEAARAVASASLVLVPQQGQACPRLSITTGSVPSPHLCLLQGILHHPLITSSGRPCLVPGALTPCTASVQLKAVKLQVVQNRGSRSWNMLYAHAAWRTDRCVEKMQGQQTWHFSRAAIQGHETKLISPSDHPPSGGGGGGRWLRRLCLGASASRQTLEACSIMTEQASTVCHV